MIVLLTLLALQDEGSPPDKKFQEGEFERRRFDRGHEEPPMTREEFEKVLAEVKEYLKGTEPAMLRRLEELEAAGRTEDVRNTVREFRGRMRQMEDLKQRDPEEYARVAQVRELERACFELAEKIRQGGTTSEDLRASLQEKLSTLFDLREQSRVRELAELKKRMEELEKVLQQRRDNKNKIIEKRFKEMVGEKDPTDW